MFLWSISPCLEQANSAAFASLMQALLQARLKERLSGCCVPRTSSNLSKLTSLRILCKVNIALDCQRGFLPVNFYESFLVDFLVDTAGRVLQVEHVEKLDMCLHLIQIGPALLPWVLSGSVVALVQNAGRSRKNVVSLSQWRIYHRSRRTRWVNPIRPKQSSQLCSPSGTIKPLGRRTDGHTRDFRKPYSSNIRGCDNPSLSVAAVWAGWMTPTDAANRRAVFVGGIICDCSGVSRQRWTSHYHGTPRGMTEPLLLEVISECLNASSNGHCSGSRPLPGKG